MYIKRGKVQKLIKRYMKKWTHELRDQHAIFQTQSQQMAWT